MLRVSRVLFGTAITFLVGGSLFVPQSLAQEGDKPTGLRGRVVVAPELLAATEWPVDANRAASLRTPANVRRGQGRRLLPMTESVPDISVVLEGEDVRPDNAPPKTLVIEGMRFAPGQALLARPGPLAVENRQGIPLTVVDDKGTVLATLAVGQTGQFNLAGGVQTLSMKELPYAAATVKVLPRGRLLPFDENGDIALLPLDAGDYSLSFYLGANELFRKPLTMPDGGLLFVDATVSANTVVDASVKDASVQIAVPVGGGPRPPQDGE